jgi:hypothetical protein
MSNGTVVDPKGFSLIEQGKLNRVDARLKGNDINRFIRAKNILDTVGASSSGRLLVFVKSIPAQRDQCKITCRIGYTTAWSRELEHCLGGQDMFAFNELEIGAGIMCLGGLEDWLSIIRSKGKLRGDCKPCEACVQSPHASSLLWDEFGRFAGNPMFCMTRPIMSPGRQRVSLCISIT